MSVGSRVPTCGHESEGGWMYAHSNCHVESPTWVRIKGNSLVIECAECKEVVATFLLQTEDAAKL